MDFKETMCRELCATARRALADLASLELERHIVSVFAEKIRRIDPDGWGGVARPFCDFREGGKGVTVRSTFEIPSELHEKITDAVKDRFDEKTAAVEFETSRDLVCGIELCAFDRKISWNIADYMESLEERVSELILKDREAARSGPAGKNVEQEQER